MRSILSFLALLCVLSGFGETIRTKADLRLWQTVDDSAAPLVWPWAEGADSAALVFSNRVTQAVSSVTVPRGADETHGNCVFAPPDEESLVDVTLVQTGGGNEVAQESATLAYVDGAGGGPITVRAKGRPGWRRFYRPRVFAGDLGWDIAWPDYVGLKLIVR